MRAFFIYEDPRFEDFVIAHEMLHWRVSPHGRLFKALMGAHVPGWRELEERRGLARLTRGRSAS